MLNNKRNDYRRRVKEQKAEGDKSITDGQELQHGQNRPTTNGHTQHADGEPIAKKPRLYEGAATNGDDTRMIGAEEGDETLGEENDNEDAEDAEDAEDDDDDDAAEEEQPENEELGADDLGLEDDAHHLHPAESTDSE